MRQQMACWLHVSVCCCQWPSDPQRADQLWHKLWHQQRPDQRCGADGRQGTYAAARVRRCMHALMGPCAQTQH